MIEVIQLLLDKDLTVPNSFQLQGPQMLIILGLRSLHYESIYVPDNH